MKYRLGCNVESLVKIQKTVTFVLNEKEYIFKPNRYGFLSSIEILTKVENPEEFFAKIIPHAIGKGHHKLEIKSDEEITQILQEEMQYLEATLMFGGSRTKIKWEDPERGWVPENEEDKKKINVLGISYERGYPKKITEIDEEYLKEIIKNRDDYDKLTMLKAFYNDGDRFFVEFKYINAIYNFYFVIEDLYGDGNTSNRLIMRSFKESTNLREFVEWARDEQILSHKKHSKQLISFLEDMGKTTSTDDIIEFLVNTRGRLHHFSRKSTLKIGTPFNQGDYETVAFFVKAIALRAILQEIYYIKKSLGRSRADSIIDTF